MDKNIIKETFNVLFNSSKNTIGLIFTAIIITAIPVGMLWGIYLLLEHFFGATAAGYAFLGFCALGGLFISLDATISWIKNAYQQAKKNIEYKR
jgi:hypothetical protein